MKRHLRLGFPAVIAVMAVMALTACGADPAPTAADHHRQRHQHSDSPASDPGASSSDVGSDSGTSTGTTVPVYFVAETPQGPRLFREFQRVPDGSDPLGVAVQRMVSGSALDPDYTTAFPDGTFASVTHSAGAGAFVVRLEDEAWESRPAGMTPIRAELALQQLVHTVQGVEQSRDPVVVQLGNDPVSLFGIDTAGGVRDDASLRSMMNITSPEQDSTTDGDSLDVSGVAWSFEATVGWEIRSGGDKLLEGSLTAETSEHLSPWQGSLDVSSLAPGHYTFVARTDDPTSGEGPGPTVDTKDFTLS